MCLHGLRVVLWVKAATRGFKRLGGRGRILPALDAIGEELLLEDPSLREGVEAQKERRTSSGRGPGHRAGGGRT